MNIQDIEAYKIRHNIDKKCRKEYYTFNRMYLYAMLFHIHKWSLSRIGIMFNVDHATVRSALIEVPNVQHTDKFQEKVQLLYDQYYFIVPTYKNTFGPRGKKGGKVEKRKVEYIVKMKMSKADYFAYLESKDPQIIYQMMWDLTVKKLKL